MGKPWTKEMNTTYYALIGIHEKIEKKQELTDDEMGLFTVAMDYLTDNVPEFVLWMKRGYLKDKMGI